MSWRDQYGRMLRSLKRIEDYNKPTEQYGDDLVHFFMDVWHLKDWIRNDTRGLPLTKRLKIKHTAENDDVLKTCAAVANRGKHLKLMKLMGKNARKRAKGRSARLQGAISVIVRDGFDAKAAKVELRLEYVIYDRKGKRRRSALEVARGGVKRWKDIITEHKLRLPAALEAGEGPRFSMLHGTRKNS